MFRKVVNCCRLSILQIVPVADWCHTTCARATHLLALKREAVTHYENFELEGPGVPAIYCMLYKKYWIVFQRAPSTTRGASGVILTCRVLRI